MDSQGQARGRPEGVHKAPSEDDIPMHGKMVHVHGELAKNEVHPVQHAPKNLNYAAVAREEIHDVAVHPPPVKLGSGKLTGVEQWDKVNSPRARENADLAELVLGPHPQSPHEEHAQHTFRQEHQPHHMHG